MRNLRYLRQVIEGPRVFFLPFFKAKIPPPFCPPWDDKKKQGKIENLFFDNFGLQRMKKFQTN